MAAFENPNVDNAKAGTSNHVMNAARVPFACQRSRCIKERLLASGRNYGSNSTLVARTGLWQIFLGYALAVGKPLFVCQRWPPRQLVSSPEPMKTWIVLPQSSRSTPLLTNPKKAQTILLRPYPSTNTMIVFRMLCGCLHAITRDVKHPRIMNTPILTEYAINAGYLGLIID
eukprot:scaffold3642_cov182-Amphora_coffeaeformis.AAC.1